MSQHQCLDCQRPIDKAGYCSNQCHTNHAQWLKRDRTWSKEIKCRNCGRKNANRMFCNYICKEAFTEEIKDEKDRCGMALRAMAAKHDAEDRATARYKPSGLPRAHSLVDAQAMERPDRAIRIED